MNFFVFICGELYLRTTFWGPCTVYLCLSFGEISGGRRSRKDITESEEMGAEGDITGTLTDNATEANRRTQHLHFVTSKLELHIDEQVKLHEKFDQRLSSQQDETFY